MRCWNRICVVILFCAAHAPYACANYFPAGFAFWGDSLTDTGNSFLAPMIPQGRMWPEWLTAFFGNSADGHPSSTGGRDFAVAGNTIDQQRIVFERWLLLGGTVDVTRLYLLWLGSNDLLDILKDVPFHPFDFLDFADRSVGNSIAQYTLFLKDLLDNGATMLAVFNIPDIAATPAAMVQSPEVRFVINQLVKNFSARLGGMLSTTFYHQNIMTLDVYTLLQEVLSHLTEFGFVDGTHAACVEVAATGQCLPIYPGAFEDHIFFNQIHPTGKVHRIVADYVISTLVAPAQVALLPQVELATNRAALTHVADSSQLSRSQRAVGDVHYFISAQNTHQQLNQSLNAWQTRSRPKQLDVVFGFDVQDSRHSSSGFLLSVAQAQGEWPHTGGYWDQDMMITAYHQWLRFPVRVVGSIGIGFADFSSVTRTFPLGITTRVEGGRTSGYHGFMNLDAAYSLFDNKTTHVDAVGSVVCQRAVVEGYTEEGSRSTTMRFDRQQHDLAEVSLGLAYHGTGDTLFGHSASPWLELRFVNGSDYTHHSLRASLVTWPHWFWLPEPATQPVRFWQGRMGLTSVWTDRLSWMVGVQYAVSTTQPRVRGLGVVTALRYQFS